jgi:hypothetical protein
LEDQMVGWMIDGSITLRACSYPSILVQIQGVRQQHMVRAKGVAGEEMRLEMVAAVNVFTKNAPHLSDGGGISSRLASGSLLIVQVLPDGVSTFPTSAGGGLLELHRAVPSAPLDEGR